MCDKDKQRILELEQENAKLLRDTAEALKFRSEERKLDAEAVFLNIKTRWFFVVPMVIAILSFITSIITIITK